MKRDELEKYIGREVRVTLFDKSVYEGYLFKTGMEEFKDNPNLYIPNKYYFLMKLPFAPFESSCLFRSSHVIKLENIESDNDYEVDFRK